MVNELKVANVLSIKTLHAQGWSQRRIARELGVNRSVPERGLRASPSAAWASSFKTSQGAHRVGGHRKSFKTSHSAPRA